MIDNGSTDGSIEDIARLDVEVLRCTERGASAARNTGLRSCGTRRTIAFLDADDEWLPDHLAVANSFLNDRNCGGTIFAGRAAIVDALGRTSSRSAPGRLPKRWGPALLLGNRIATSGVVVQLRPRDELQFRDDLQFAEDLELWLRLYQRGYTLTPGPHVTLRYFSKPPRYSRSQARSASVTLRRLALEAPALSTLDRALAVLGTLKMQWL